MPRETEDLEANSLETILVPPCEIFTTILGVMQRSGRPGAVLDKLMGSISGPSCSGGLREKAGSIWMQGRPSPVLSDVHMSDVYMFTL